MDIRSTLRVIVIVMVVVGAIWVLEIVTAYENLMWLRMFSKVYLGLKLYWLILVILIHYHLRDNGRPLSNGITLWSQGRLDEVDVWAPMFSDDDQLPVNGIGDHSP